MLLTLAIQTEFQIICQNEVFQSVSVPLELFCLLDSVKVGTNIFRLNVTDRLPILENKHVWRVASEMRRFVDYRPLVGFQKIGEQPLKM